MKRTTILLLVTVLAIIAGTITVLATPKYQEVATRPTPGPLLVVETTPTPTPTPSPTPSPTPAPTVAATPNGTVTIAMPVYKQTMALDCETAALQMGLAALGHTYSQTYLFNQMSYDPRAPVVDRSNPRAPKVVEWGDPYQDFVGNVNGSDLGPTGYGVYWPPILSVAKANGAAASSGGVSYSATQIYAALAQGHPVLVWVETGWENARAAGYLGTWTSWPNKGSKPINYSLIEHVVTLSGVSPTQVRVNDPWKSGSQYWFSKTAFEASWADFNNMAVVLQ